MQFLKKRISKNGFAVDYTLSLLGDNYVIFAGGGEEHIGSVVLAIPRPGLSDPDKISSTASVMNVVGHKDDEIARPLAEALCIASNKPAVAIAGIHYDDIDLDGIKTIQMINRQAIDEIKKWIGEIE